MKFKASTIADLNEIARHILSNFESDIYTFTGNLGAGKTTFIKVICAELGVQDLVSSPTFSVINEYTYSDKVLYHMDWYRMESTEQLLNIGLEEYLYSGNICLIEWPQIGSNLLESSAVHIDIQIDASSDRVITINKSIHK